MTSFQHSMSTASNILPLQNDIKHLRTTPDVIEPCRRVSGTAEWAMRKQGGGGGGGFAPERRIVACPQAIR
jgi:hypothetical protein